MNKRTPASSAVGTQYDDVDVIEGPRRISEWRRFRRVFLGRGVVIFGAVIILVFILAAIFAPFIAPYNPYQRNLSLVLSQPSREHLLGTDGLGRDTLSRIIFGTRTALMVGIITVGIAAVAGVALGLIAGYYGGWIQTIIMRLMDALMAFPMILLALVLATLLGGGLRNVMIALGISFMPGYARLMCGQVLSIKENDYVLAEYGLGASNIRIMLRHIFPNCITPIIVLVTMMMGMAILSEASLSFLGVGIEPPTPAWGSMVNDGYMYLRTVPVLSFAPGCKAFS